MASRRQELNPMRLQHGLRRLQRPEPHDSILRQLRSFPWHASDVTRVTRVTRDILEEI